MPRIGAFHVRRCGRGPRNPWPGCRTTYGPPNLASGNLFGNMNRPPINLPPPRRGPPPNVSSQPP